MKKKILVVDDSALMRRVLCDIINSDDRFEVADTATNGVEGFKLIVSRQYDAVVLDVYMPRMTGLEMLKEMQKSGVKANVMMASTTTEEGAKETLDALELGAIDFIKKPENVADARHAEFIETFLNILNVVANSRLSLRRPVITPRANTGVRTPAVLPKSDDSSKKPIALAPRKTPVTGEKIVAIASSTGGPRALQDVIPRLPKNLNAPVLLVQHMPKGFTKSLADRLNELSEITVSEAVDGEIIEKGHVYIAPGGVHMKVRKKGTGYAICYSDEPAREGVKPCANYMYESLIDSDFAEITCAVLTGMGADGTAGIKALNDGKKVFIVAQDEDTSTVYGMPRAIALTGLCNSVVPLSNIAGEIIKNVGVR